MKYKIIKNSNIEIYNSVTEAVINNDGYCPCMIDKTVDTKCICKEFKEQDYVGECHCGRYLKIEMEENNI